MKELLLRSSVVLGAVAVVVGGTLAFYADAETSTGNVFTAGSIDLKIDHTRLTYNGEECGDGSCVTDETTNLIANGSFENPIEPNDFGFYDDGTPGIEWRVDWEGGSETYQGQARPEPAHFELQKIGTHADGNQHTELDTGWGNPVIADEPSSVRIWQDITTTPGEKYELRYFYAARGGSNVDDNILNVRIDGALVQTLGPITDDTWVEYTYMFTAGSSTTRVMFADGGNPDTRGSLLDHVRVHPVQCTADSDELLECSLWEEKDLVEGEDIFFQFHDIKPGDFGRNSISMHVYDNDAWGCLIAHDGVDEENTLQEPEVEMGDDATTGELSDYITYATWMDADNDGEFDPGSDVLTASGALSGLGSIANMDSTNGLFLAATSTQYVAFAWCAGEMNLDEGTGEVSCDGSTMENDSMSDSFSASLTAYAEQTRNNDNFLCSSVDVGDQGQQVLVGQI